MLLLSTIIALLVLASLIIFQLLLISGKPLGDFAWGGQHKVLPRNLRIASISSIIIYLVFVIFLVSKSGVLVIIPPSSILDIGMWIITGYFFLGVLVNLASRNKKERTLMTPTALLLALTFLVVSLS